MIAKKVLSTLGIPTALENFIYAKSIRKIPWYVAILFYRLFPGQSWHKESQCYANTHNCKERSNKLLTVSHQRNPKSIFKYSLGQQSNATATVRRALPQRYIATLSMYEHNVFTHNDKYILFFIWLTITYLFHRALFANVLIFLIFFLNKKIYGKTFGTTNFRNTYMSVRNEPLLTAEIFNFKKESLECIAY